MIGLFRTGMAGKTYYLISKCRLCRCYFTKKEFHQWWSSFF